MTEPRAGPARGWDPASDDVRMLQIVDLVCGLERELALQLLSVLYSDPEEVEDEPEARPA